MITLAQVNQAMRTMRQLASDPVMKKNFKSDERKILNDAANILRAASSMEFLTGKVVS